MRRPEGHGPCDPPAILRLGRSGEDAVAVVRMWYHIRYDLARGGHGDGDYRERGA